MFKTFFKYLREKIFFVKYFIYFLSIWEMVVKDTLQRGWGAGCETSVPKSTYAKCTIPTFSYFRCLQSIDILVLNCYLQICEFKIGCSCSRKIPKQLNSLFTLISVRNLFIIKFDRQRIIVHMKLFSSKLAMQTLFIDLE